MKQKRIIIILPIVLILIAVIFKGYYAIKQESIIQYDTIIPDDVNFIDAEKSPNFYYTLSINVNKIKKEEYNSLQYNLKIEPKRNDVVYNKVIATAFLDKNMIDILAIKSSLVFGTDISENILINANDPKNKGLIIGRTTWISNRTEKEKVMIGIKKPIKLKVKWEDGEEYVILNSDNMVINMYD
ncbi:hypothetical protein [Tepidibacillus decaturensis]|uniref:Uncharacterized protein n=1 Tax=Tepidibacillus decaturensis TaxID=1413211 RepID=A0A135L105_9BACI|nr:hypothetical protein [Tepidibacillus decaturensis]KXG42625.1 hypothetical protein U473_00120 [Tepidibacillus decaturensis]